MSQRELCYQDLVVSVHFDNRLDRDAVLHVRCPVRTLIFSVAAGLGYHRSDFVFCLLCGLVLGLLAMIPLGVSGFIPFSTFCSTCCVLIHCCFGSAGLASVCCSGAFVARFASLVVRWARRSPEHGVPR